MAISSATQWDVRTTGSDTNGGGYSSGGTDYSQQNSAQLSLTDAVANGTTTITSATAGFTSNMVGNTCYMQGGTGSLTAVRRQITAYTNSTTVTVDATVATGTGITMNVGGSLATPAEPFTRGCVAGNTVWIKGGTYSTAVKIVPVAGSSGLVVQTIGYATTHGDSKDYVDSGVIINASATISSFAIISVENGYNLVANIKTSPNGNSVVRGFRDGGGYNTFVGCLASGTYTSEGMDLQSGGGFTQAIRCHTDTAGMGIIAFIAERCTTKGALTTNFAFKCIAYDTGGSVDGFLRQQAGPLIWAHCTAFNCGGDGFQIEGSSNARNTVLDSCLAVKNGGYGYNSSASANCAYLINCAAQGNTSGAKNNVLNADIGTVTTSTLSGDPLTNSSGANASLDNTAGEGATLRGISGAYSILTSTTDYGDIGAVQHQDSGGGGGLAMPVSGPA